MNIRSDEQAREFAEMLAVPWPTASPTCPVCGQSHALEQPCAPHLGFWPYPVAQMGS